MATATVDSATFKSAQQAISDLNQRLQELAIAEMRGQKVSHRLRRTLQNKRNEAHKVMRRALGKS